MAFPSFQPLAEQTRSQASKTPLVGMHLRVHANDETVLDVPEAGINNVRPSYQGRSLSLRITDLVDEAFPLPALPLSGDQFNHHSSENSESMEEVTTRGGSSQPPPAYIPLPQPPRYSASGSLADQLPDSFSVPIIYHRLSLVSPTPDRPYNTYHDLILLAPKMPWNHFLQKVEQKATTYILSERSAKRLLPDEKVVLVPEVKEQTEKGEWFRRARVVKNAIREESWQEVVSMLKERPEDAELEVRFWTERRGSHAHVPGKKRSVVGGVDVGLLGTIIPGTL